ncbi:basic proline-rich protein-like [Felis catus]|uniref:basic proline-rich protein-like n=1 Tax=Felis catus TaxID=9685 RepID=UPI001D1A1FCE|nr:basic proline-rich protein-like [Felis catus]
MTAKDTSVSAASQPGQRRRAHTRRQDGRAQPRHPGLDHTLSRPRPASHPSTRCPGPSSSPSTLAASGYRPPPAPTEQTLTLTLTLTTGGDRQRRRPAPLGKPSVDHVRGPPGSDRLRAWPAPPGPSASIPPTRLRLGPEAPASARPAARRPHAVHPARRQHPQNAGRRPPSHPHAASAHVPSAQRAGTPSPTASARRAWPGGPRSGAKGRAAALAGNRTRVNCLEGSYAHHYTTNAARPGPARRGRPRVRSGAFSPWRSLAAAAAAARRSPAPTSRPAAALPGHHGLRPPGAPASPLRLSCAGRSPGTPARPPTCPPCAPRPAPRARRPPPPASGGRSGRLAALGRSEAGWGAPPRPRPGVFRVLRGPQLAARPGPARPGASRPGAGRSRGGGRQATPPPASRRDRTHLPPTRATPTAAARLGGTSPRSSPWLPRGPHEAPAARWPPSVRPRATQRAGAGGRRAGRARAAGRTTDGREAAPLPLGSKRWDPEAPGTGHAPPDPSPASAPSPARQPPAPTRSPPGPGAHTRTRTALSTPNERCLSLVCQAGIAPGEKAPDATGAALAAAAAAAARRLAVLLRAAARVSPLAHPHSRQPGAMTAKDTSVSAASQPGQRRRAHTRPATPPGPGPHPLAAAARLAPEHTLPGTELQPLHPRRLRLPLSRHPPEAAHTILHLGAFPWPHLPACLSASREPYSAAVCWPAGGADPSLLWAWLTSPSREDRPPPAPTEQTLTLTLTLTTGGDRQRRRPAPLGKPSVDHVRGPPGSDRLRAWPAPPGPSASIPPTRLRLGPEAPASARPAARRPHAVHPARRQHPQNAGRRPPSHPHAASAHVPSAQRAGTPSPTASARRAWPGGPRSGAKGRAAALAGNRTRVNCLEGSYAHHYTTNAARPGPARRGRPRVRSGAFSPWRSLAAAAAAARRSPAPTSRPAAALPGHHGLRPPGAPASPLRLSCAGRSPGTPARPPTCPPCAPRPAPRARRPPPPASGGRSGRLAALGRSEAGWGAPPRPRPGVFRVLRGPQLAARPGPARPGASRPGAGRSRGGGRQATPPPASRRDRTHLPPTRATPTAAARLGGTSPRSSPWLPRGPHEAPAARWPPSVRPRATQRAGAGGRRAGRARAAGRTTDGREAAPLPLGSKRWDPEAPGTGHAPPDPSPASAPSPARQPPAPTRSPPGPGAHTRTRTALSTPNERCLSLVCQAGIAPGEKAPDGKRG